LGTELRVRTKRPSLSKISSFNTEGSSGVLSSSVALFLPSRHSVVCQLALNSDDSAYELRLNPPWDLQGTTTEVFDDAMPAFQRHAAIERVLVDEGWLLEGFETV